MGEFEGRLSNNDYEQLMMLVKSDADYQEFIDHAKTARNLKFAVVGYREMKLKKQDYPVEKFVEDYGENSTVALQRLFLHPVIKGDVERVNAAVQTGKLTLIDLHARHIAEPTKQLLRVAFVA